MAVEQGTSTSQPAGSRAARGGVSPKPHAPAIHGVETLGKPVSGGGPGPNPGAFPGFAYYGGPVISCPWVYTSFWGPLWLQDAQHLESAAQLCQYHEDLLRSGFMNVLSQYGVGWGADSGAFVQPSFVRNVPSTLTDNGIQGIIQSCIDAGVLPEPGNPSNVTLIVYLDETIGINDPNMGLVLCEPSNDTAFGYHYFFMTRAGNPFYYAMIPALNDACLTESCPGDDAGCSLHLSERQQQRQTQVASHEFAEMTTDPQINAWLDPFNGENGDICNGETDTITVGDNTWTVQTIYSKYDDVNTNGLAFCSSQEPEPTPRLSYGPYSVTRNRHIESYRRVLPLPALRFDLQTGDVTIDHHQLREYVERLFHPLHPHDIVGDFPAFLTKMAEALVKGK